MIVLFTDFGLEGPYVGQMMARIRTEGYDGDIINLFADAPTFSSQYSGILLSRYHQEFPAGSVFICVVDPGVGSDRKPVALKCDGKWFVGPDNGIFEYLMRSSKDVETYEIRWRPEKLSSSFHGRDLFAPVAARIKLGQTKELFTEVSALRTDWPDEICEVIYIDHYGNCMTGLNSDRLKQSIFVGGKPIQSGRTFSSVKKGTPLIYENSNGLIEIAVNQGRADELLGLSIGSPISVTD